MSASPRPPSPPPSPPAPAAPPPNRAAPKGEWGLLKRLGPWVTPEARTIWLAVALLPFMVACTVAQPMLLGKAIDRSVLEGDPASLPRLAAYFVLAALGEYVFGSIHAYLLSRVGTRVIGALRLSVFRHVLSQGQRFFDRRAAGVLLSRTTSDVEAIGESFFNGVVSVVADLARLGGIVATMLTLDAGLTLASFAAIPVLWVVVDFFRRRVRDYGLAIRSVVAKMNGIITEHLAGIDVVRLSGGQEAAAAEFSGVAKGALRTYHWSNFYDAALFAVMDALGSIAIGMLVWYASGKVFAGDVTPGLLVAFVEYVQRALVPIKEFSGKYAILQHSFAGMEKVYDLLDTHEQVGSGHETPARPCGAVAFRGVGYSYPGTDRQVLTGVTFDVLPGQVVALVGATGAGKSTVCRLLARSYDGYSGSITIGGVEVDRFELRALANVVAVVPQDIALFRGTVRFNLTLGAAHFDDDALWRALALVQADGFVRALGGLDAEVGERGGRLSVGQGQLLTLARAMCRDPEIVVLDEATASVDPATEVLIQGALDAIFELKTVVVVAHRLSTIRAADVILVMDRGEIVERGSHDELIAAGGRYAELHAAGQTASVLV